MKILMVLTSHDQLGDTGRKTGFWLEEFAAPYFVFRDAGVQLTLASPKGGQPPVDPKSDLPENQTSAMARFKQDKTAQQALAHTVKLADQKAVNEFLHSDSGHRFLVTTEIAYRQIADGGGIELATELATKLATTSGVDALHIYPLGAEAATRDIAAHFRSARGVPAQRLSMPGAQG